jgi:hypothetical protein
MRRTKTIAILTLAAMTLATPLVPDRLPLEAVVFVKEFERVSKQDTGLGIWERVVYSLVEAKSQVRHRRAPEGKSATSTACGLLRPWASS